MRKSKLSAQDLTFLRAYFNVRNANPCSDCSSNAATCCGCKEQSEWLEKFRAAESLIKDVDDHVRLLFENYIKHTENINRLDKELQVERRALMDTCDELGEYLDQDIIKSAGLL